MRLSAKWRKRNRIRKLRNNSYNINVSHNNNIRNSRDNKKYRKTETTIIAETTVISETIGVTEATKAIETTEMPGLFLNTETQIPEKTRRSAPQKGVSIIWMNRIGKGHSKC